MRFAAGQRWISEPEPELGLGIVLDVEPLRIKMFFPASNAMRLYAAASAPLRRVRFKVGDTIHSHEGESFVVHVVNERSDGVLVYGGPGTERLPETQLSDTLIFDKPAERIPVGQVDDHLDFELRLAALRYQHQARKSPVCGFVGARIDLIPHQLAIAHEVASRHAPRVLLADQVGLGKTIEACLILHRLHLTGKASRVLILVPEPLVHQWFVELLRRFNLRFAIFDEERCLAIEANEPEANPFLDDQLILCPVGWVAGNARRWEQAVAAGWELLVVDEAHHLVWSPQEASPEYRLVEALASATPGVLLLTATPQQLGEAGHFARLRLLDPDRYPSLEAFRKEAKAYGPIAKVAGKLAEKKKLTAREYALLKAMPGRVGQHAVALEGGDATAAVPLLEELLDQHGVGRVMFRNTRAALKGFPRRKVKLIPLEGDPEAALAEYRGEAVSLHKDARILWLAKWLSRLKGAKVLLIARTREKAEAIREALAGETRLAGAVFHEGLTLLERDRNAASFASEEPEAVQVLICSEIGSEGRNFQFARHLVLFDLPEDPEVLEQRIGRLDRIGRSGDIEIQVPYVEGGPYERLARWLHEGLNAFEESLPGAAQIYDHFGQTLATLLGGNASARKWDTLLEQTRKMREEVRKRLAEGEDKLLALNSGDRGTAAGIIEAIHAFDADTALDDFMLKVFDLYQFDVEDIAARTWLVKPVQGGDTLPGIPPEGALLTADRQRALSREDVVFLSWDHPAVRGAFEALLSGRLGNAAVALTPHPGPESALLETVHIVEAIAPGELHIDRFLPATPIRTVIDNRFTEIDEVLAPLENAPLNLVLSKSELCHKLLPKLLEQAQRLATAQADQIVAMSIHTMQTQLGAEADRLEDLRAGNPNVRENEIETARQQIYDLRDHLADARVRLDAVRLIFRSSRPQTSPLP